jgi:HD-GYP domain-containing protein (c-di-GMP phosphodiesterase class II)
MRRSNARESEKKVKQFTTLIELGTILNSTLEQQEVRRRAMEAATRLMNCEAGSLLLLDEEKGDLFFEVALGEKGEAVKELRLKVGEGIAGWVAKTGKPLLVPDVTKDSRHSKRADDKSSFVTRNILCVPVKVKEKLIGVLQAINKLDGEEFREEDIELFQLLANQVAIAIDNARLYEEVRDTFIGASTALAEAIEKRDPYTGGHTRRVLEYSLATAKYLKLTPQETENLRIAAILHDVGKIGVEDRILRKTEKLNHEEFNSISTHPEVGKDILAPIKALKDVIPGIYYHHERIDGKGYPECLKDNEIPLIARIIAVTDTYDAMTTDRPYRKGLSTEAAVNELKKFSGTQFDKEVVEAFVKAYHQGEIKNSPSNQGEPR